jgi:hypothetical protein
MQGNKNYADKFIFLSCVKELKAMKDEIWKRNVRKRILLYLMNILTTLGMWNFSPNLGAYGKPFLKLLLQVMFSVNGM